jgi:hypothetical protein
MHECREKGPEDTRFPLPLYWEVDASVVHVGATTKGLAPSIHLDLVLH